MSNANDYADGMRESIREVMAALEAGEEYDGQDAREYLDEWPLEIVHRVGSDFRILLTYGGPSAYVRCELGEDGERVGSATLEVSWGTEETRRYADAINRFVDYYAEMYA